MNTIALNESIPVFEHTPSSSLQILSDDDLSAVSGGSVADGLAGVGFGAGAGYASGAIAGAIWGARFGGIVGVGVGALVGVGYVLATSGGGGARLWIGAKLL